MHSFEMTVTDAYWDALRERAIIEGTRLAGMSEALLDVAGFAVRAKTGREVAEYCAMKAKQVGEEATRLLGE